MNEKIPDHRKAFWKFEDVHKGKGSDYVKSYYHSVNATLPLHSHDFYEINIVVSGSGKHYIRDKELLAAQGDIFVIPRNVKHGYTCREDMKVYHILLSNRFSVEFGALLEKLPGYRFLFHIEPMLRGSLDKPFYLKSDCISVEAVKAYIHKIEAAGSEPEMICHILSFISDLSGRSQRLSRLPDHSLPDRQVIPLIESIAYIENHYAQKLDHRALADRCAVSYSTYWRLFKKLTGLTPMEYQLNCRINAAEMLLKSSDEPVLSVALSCGFYDSSHFIREFIKRKGMSPAEYRKTGG